MRGTVWLFAMALLVLLAAGCERQELPPQVAPQPLPVAEEQKESVVADEPVAVIVEENAQQEEAPAPAPAEGVKPAPVKTVKPMPVPVAVDKPEAAAVEKPAAVEVATPKTTDVVPSAPAEEKPAKMEVAAAQPELVTYHASYGRVLFNHKSHAASSACSSCHNSSPATKIPLGKDKAHQWCRGCHQQSGAGPTQCNTCHQKG